MDLLRALAVMAETPSPEQRQLASLLELGNPPPESAYSELFVLQLPPYSSIYLGQEGMLGGNARGLAAGFWRALGQDPPDEPDHLATLLGLYARLSELEVEGDDSRDGDRWHHARKALFWEHLASWIFPYLEALTDAGGSFYRQWARLLAERLIEEADELGGPETPPLLLREAGPLTDPRRGGGEAFLASLLSPVRSGLILTQADLARAARELRLGLRKGERRFVLRTLLGQDPEAALDWLTREAAAWSERHRQRSAALLPVSEHWLARSDAAAALLGELRADLPNEPL